ncbi:MAG TPA: SDR family oxidoreductase [Clostridiaceae bacterium]|nr:SDR family oxidoreductase [Clostridiaceae bacterium]
MGKIHGDVVFVTGASSGIGREIARAFMDEGYRVYGTTRKKALQEDEVQLEKSKNSSGFIKMIRLDVCDEESVEKAVSYVYQKEGRIDILVNNAGFGIAGSIEDTSTEEALEQFNTNFFGVHRMCRHVVPIMRKNGGGLIINISSVAAQFSIPFQAMYSASKYAVEALSEALRIETRPFGIKVSVVEPGDTKTGFTQSRQYVKGSDENSVYFDTFKKSVEKMIKDETSGPGPEVVAKAVLKIAKRKNPPIRVTVGTGYKVIVFLKRFLPVRFVQYMVSKMYS